MKLVIPSVLTRSFYQPPKRLQQNCGVAKSACGTYASIVVAGLLATPWAALAAETIPLGAAQSFSVLGGSTVTNTGPTVIVGNLGLSPGTSVTGFPPGTVSGAIHINDVLADQAHDDAFAAYTLLEGEAFDTDLTGMDLGGLTLTPGVYRFSSSAQLTGTLMLDTGGDPNAPFHFQIGSTLTTGTDASVLVLGLNGAPYNNIFWQVGSSATIGAGTDFEGNVLALTSVTLLTGANIVNGRAIAINGAVTLDTNQIGSQAIAVPEPGSALFGLLICGSFLARRRRA